MKSFIRTLALIVSILASDTSGVKISSSASHIQRSFVGSGHESTRTAILDKELQITLPTRDVSRFGTSFKALSVRGGGVATRETNVLIFGYGIIFAGMLPYILQIVFPELLNKYFFFPNYPVSEEGRNAENGWKTRFAFLSFALVTILAVDVFRGSDTSPEVMLRHSYFAFAVFYADAVWKVRKEAQKGWFAADKRFAAQAWHITVLLSLVLNLSAYPGTRSAKIIESFMSSKVIQALPVTWLFKKLGLVASD